MVFGPWPERPLPRYARSFLCIPPLIWAALRFGLHGSVAAAVIIDAMATWGTLRGDGPFAVGDPNTSLLLLQGFMVVISGTALLTAGAVYRQQETEAELARHRDHLQELVEQRTAELEATYERLRLAEHMSALGARLPRVSGTTSATCSCPSGPTWRHSSSSRSPARRDRISPPFPSASNTSGA
jgi:hypothetical protein